MISREATDAPIRGQGLERAHQRMGYWTRGSLESEAPFLVAAWEFAVSPSGPVSSVTSGVDQGCDSGVLMAVEASRDLSAEQDPVRRVRWHARFMAEWSTELVAAKGRRAGQYVRSVSRDVAGLRSNQGSSAETHLLLRRAHRWTGGRSSDATLALLRTVTPRDARESRAAMEPAEWAGALAGLRAEGVTRVPPILDAEAVARVTEFARTAPARLSSADGARRHGTYHDRDSATSMAFVIERFVLDNPDVQSLLADPGLLWLTRQFFGMRPEVHPPILYWSCVQAGSDGFGSGTRQFHWDYDGIGCLRLHVNLTAVDEGAAPMQYVAGSHRSGSLRTSELRAGDRGVPDEVIWREFGRGRIVTLTGPAGSMFVSDPRGLHRGTTPTRTDRLFMIVPLAATTFGAYQLLPRKVTPRNADFSRLLAEGRPEYRLFRPDTGPGSEIGRQ